MRVLSLFDGMSCGQIALKEIGITPEVYYVSEIDKFAIILIQHLFPLKPGNVFIGLIFKAALSLNLKTKV